MKRILDPQFRYRPSFDTDLKRTFERIRLEQAARSVQTHTKPRIVRLGELKKANSSSYGE